MVQTGVRNFSSRFYLRFYSAVRHAQNDGQLAGHGAPALVKASYEIRKDPMSQHDGKDSSVSFSKGQVSRDDPVIHVYDEDSKLFVKQSIKRSFPKASPTKLMIALEHLVSTKPSSDMPRSGILMDGKLTNPHRWTLQTEGDIIHRTVTVPRTDIDRLEREISIVADEMGHHPHLAKQWRNDYSVWLVGISCTTHQPAGLSLKDARLAMKIDSLIDKLSREGAGVEPLPANGALLAVSEMLRRENTDAARSVSSKSDTVAGGATGLNISQAAASAATKGVL